MSTFNQSAAFPEESESAVVSDTINELLNSLELEAPSIINLGVPDDAELGDDDSLEAPTYSEITNFSGLSDSSNKLIMDEEPNNRNSDDPQEGGSGYNLRSRGSIHYGENCTDESESSDEEENEQETGEPPKKSRPSTCKFMDHLDWEIHVKARVHTNDGEEKLLIRCPDYLAKKNRCSNVRGYRKLPVLNESQVEAMDFSDHEDAQMDYAKKHPVQFQCLYCSLRFDNARGLSRHVLGKTNAKDKRYYHVDCLGRSKEESIPSRIRKSYPGPKRIPWGKPVMRDDRDKRSPLAIPGVKEDLDQYGVAY